MPQLTGTTPRVSIVRSRKSAALRVGVVTARVLPNSPAAEAGIRPFNAQSGDLGDVIVAVNGRPVASLPSFASELDRVGVDQTAELTVIRDGKERRVRVRVVDMGR